MFKFILTKRTAPKLLNAMSIHYSQPKGFVGRNLCYAVYYKGLYYGYIVGGSATRFLPGRNEFLGIGINDIDRVINNIFYHVERKFNKYPIRNFTSTILNEWMPIVIYDWERKYNDSVVGFESLVELPRTGELYRKAGWSLVGQTKGFTCKRAGGEGTDGWSGKRIWNTVDLKPKLVFCYKL